MGRKNFGYRKKSSHSKKQKKARKPSKGYPGIPQEQVTCREVAIYVPPDEESDQELDDDDMYCYDCGCRHDAHDDQGFPFNLNISTRSMYRIFAAMMISELVEQRMMGNRRGPFGFSGRRARC